ncbi:MAG: DUF4034 domain-containing protein [Burkholderiaceae bacterium]|jgi:tetratricopeptide (TPR) repeat protein|nr:DUF4034 domain-containing protein [Burkholderiaceae bacterium]
MKTSNLIKTAVAGVTLCLVAVGNVQAEQCQLVDAVNSQATIVKQYNSQVLFRDAKFSQLEVLLEKRYLESLNSEGGDLLMLNDINDVVQGNTGADKLVHMWIDQYPGSFLTQLGAGLFYIHWAPILSGIPNANGQSENMHEFNAKAIAYLQKAMQLNPRSVLPYSSMIDVAGVERQAAGKDVQEWLQIANQVDPKNLSARTQAIIYLSPKWGGSFELMEQVVQQAQKLLSAQDIHYLEFLVIMQKARYEEVVTVDYTKAYALYKQALNMCENSKSARAGMIHTYQIRDDN